MIRIALLFLAFCLPFCSSVFAQDKILYLDGQEEMVKVLEISLDSVRFSSLSDTLSPVKIKAIPATAVFSVTFRNGRRELLAKPDQPATETLSNEALYRQGRTDAKRYYKAISTYWGSLGVTVVANMALPIAGTLVGFGTGAVASLSDVPDKKIIASNPEFKQSPSYLRGYQKQARNKKLGSAAAGAGTGTIVLTAILFAILSSEYK